MFTQLDLFGNLPSREKQPDKPTKPERRSNTRNAGSGAPSPVHAQLTMGLPEQASPDQLRMFGENKVEEEKKEEADNSDLTLKAAAELPAVTYTSSDDTPAAPLESLPDSKPEMPIIKAASGPGPTAIQKYPESQTNNEASVTQTGEKPSNSRKRYYIQTEIPADPPLEPKQVTPDFGMTTPPTGRQINTEPKPRYIQTEIPSDPPVKGAEHPEQSGSSNLAGGVQEDALLQVKTETIPGLAADVSVTYHSEPEKKPTITGIPPESLRRTRPLMPPKVILAEPAAEVPRALKPSTDTEGKLQSTEAAAGPDLRDDRPNAPEKASTSNIEGSKVDAHAVRAIQENSSPTEPLQASVITKPGEIFPVVVSTEGFPPADISTKRVGGRTKKTIREVPAESANPGIPPDDVLNSRQYYSIGEVAGMFAVKPSLLRYWESEFDVLKLRKNRKGDRFFRPDDIRSLQLIHHLLREKKYTIEGAREYMRNARKMKEKFETIEALQRIRQFLVEMRNGLQTENVGDLH